MASREHEITIFPFCPKSAMSAPAGSPWKVVLWPPMLAVRSTTISICGNWPIWGIPIGYFGLGAETPVTDAISI